MKKEYRNSKLAKIMKKEVKISMNTVIELKMEKLDDFRRILTNKKHGHYFIMKNGKLLGELYLSRRLLKLNKQINEKLELSEKMEQIKTKKDKREQELKSKNNFISKLLNRKKIKSIKNELDEQQIKSEEMTKLYNEFAQEIDIEVLRDINSFVMFIKQEGFEVE